MPDSGRAPRVRNGTGPRIVAGLGIGLLLIGLPISLAISTYYDPPFNAEYSWAWHHLALPAAVVLFIPVAIRPGYWFPTRPTLSAPKGPGVIGPLIVLGVIWFAALGTSAGLALWVNANVGRSVPEAIVGPIARKHTASGGRGRRSYLLDLPLSGGRVATLAVGRAMWDSVNEGERFDVALQRGSLGIVYRRR